jgi:hypothetical protein
MKKITTLLAALTLTATTWTAQAGLEIVQSIESTGPAPMKMEMTVRVQGDQARVDIGDQMSTLMGGGSKDVTTLMHGQKMAMTIPAAAMAAMKGKMEKAGAKDEKPDIKPTGQKKEISGFACEEYTGTVGGLQATYWLTNDLPNQEEITKQLSALAGDMDPFKGVLANNEIPGFPIQTEVTSPEAGKSIVTIKSVTEKEIPADTFKVPTDYKTTAMPNLGQ